MPKCDFNKVTYCRCSPVNLQHIFRTPVPKNTSGRLLPNPPNKKTFFLIIVINYSFKMQVKGIKFLKNPHYKI